MANCRSLPKHMTKIITNSFLGLRLKFCNVCSPAAHLARIDAITVYGQFWPRRFPENYYCEGVHTYTLPLELALAIASILL